MKFATVIAAIILTNTCAFADELSVMDKITKNIKDVCQSPDSKSEYWDISAKAGGGTSKMVKLVGIGVNAEASFSKKEWDGVQKVLRTDQARDNESYRVCVFKLTPLFLNKFVKEKTKTTDEKTTKKKKANGHKVAAKSSPKDKPSENISKETKPPERREPPKEAIPTQNPNRQPESSGGVSQNIDRSPGAVQMNIYGGNNYFPQTTNNNSPVVSPDITNPCRKPTTFKSKVRLIGNNGTILIAEGGEDFVTLLQYCPDKWREGCGNRFPIDRKGNHFEMDKEAISEHQNAFNFLNSSGQWLCIPDKDVTYDSALRMEKGIEGHYFVYVGEIKK